MDTDVTARTASRGRTLAFRIVAAVAGLAAVGFSLPFTVVSFVSEEDAIHRMHNLSALIGFGGLVGVLLLVCAWRPDDHLVTFRVVVATAAAGVLTGAISGDLLSGGWVVSAVLVVIAWALHPLRAAVLGVTPFDLPPVVLSVLAFVPGIAWALSQAELQRNGVPSLDPHAEFHHYSGMAAAGITIPLAGLAAATAGAGRRFAAWFVGASVVVMGLSSILLSDQPGAFDALWSWLLVAGGIAYAALTEASLRRVPDRVGVG